MEPQKLILIVIAIIVFIFIVKVVLYYNTGFHEKTGIRYLKVLNDKGAKGEYELYLKLIKVFPKEQIYADLYVPSKNGHTQIDIVVISGKRIYVMEMKNYTGSIVGKEDERFWVQTFNAHNVYDFYNPIWQNNGHASALTSYLGNPYHIISKVIVFNDRVTFANVQTSGETALVKMSNLINLLKKIENDSRTEIYDRTRNKYDELLQPCIRVSRKIKRKHLKHVRRK